LVGMYISTTNMEGNMDFPLKSRNKTTT
jgi:hypothetical protein